MTWYCLKIPKSFCLLIVVITEEISETYLKGTLMILFLHFCRSVVIPMMMTAVFIGKCSPSLISGEKGKMGGKKRTQVPNSSKQITRHFFSLVQLKLWYMKKMYVLLLYTTLNILIKIRIETMNAFPWWHILVKCHMFSDDQKPHEKLMQRLSESEIIFLEEGRLLWSLPPNFL